MELGGAFLTLRKVLLQRVTEHLKRSRYSVNSSLQPLPLPPVGRNPRSRPPPGCEAEFTGPGPGAAQPLLLPPGGWASPSRTHRAWAAVHPQPGFCDLSSSCQNPHMWSTQGTLQRLLWALAPRPCAVAWGTRASESQKHTQLGENYTPWTLTSRGKSLASGSHRRA